MQRLVQRITDEFPENVEIFVLDGNGDPFEVFKGNSSDLSPYNFSNILTEPSCFYFFDIASAVHSTDLNDLQQVGEANMDNVRRRDLCWLTDPMAPIVNAVSPESLTVSWSLVRFCGIPQPREGAAMLDTVLYSLEVAEGLEWKDGFISKFMNDTTTSTYKRVCSGPGLSSISISDLKPARWYHLRLRVSYLGHVTLSETISTHTSKSCPSQPGTPRVYVVPVANAFDPTPNAPAKYKLQISWTASQPNGSKIVKYKLQLMQINLLGNPLVESDDQTLVRRMNVHIRNEDDFILGGGTAGNVKKESNQWTRSPGKSIRQIKNSLTVQRTKASKQTRDGSVLIDTEGMGDAGEFAGARSPSTSPWVTVYANLNRTVVIKAPGAAESAWHFRVKAKNSVGWSEFSDVLVINAMTHPTLFNVSDMIPMSAVYVPSASAAQDSEVQEGRKESQEDSAVQAIKSNKSYSADHHPTNQGEGVQEEGLFGTEEIERQGTRAHAHGEGAESAALAVVGKGHHEQAANSKASKALTSSQLSSRRSSKNSLGSNSAAHTEGKVKTRKNSRMPKSGENSGATPMARSKKSSSSRSEADATLGIAAAEGGGTSRHSAHYSGGGYGDADPYKSSSVPSFDQQDVSPFSAILQHHHQDEYAGYHPHSGAASVGSINSAGKAALFEQFQKDQYRLPTEEELRHTEALRRSAPAAGSNTRHSYGDLPPLR